MGGRCSGGESNTSHAVSSCRSMSYSMKWIAMMMFMLLLLLLLHHCRCLSPPGAAANTITIDSESGHIDVCIGWEGEWGVGADASGGTIGGMSQSTVVSHI